MIGDIRSRPLHVIALAPRPSAVAARDAARAKTAYAAWAVDPLDHALRQETPRVGLWLDTSDQTPAQTVDEILSRAPEEAVLRAAGT
jgi:hypothetical protein